MASAVDKSKLDQNWKLLLQSHPDLLKKKKSLKIKDTPVTDQLPSYKKQSGKNKFEVWFDDVDEIYIQEASICNRPKENQLVKNNSFDGLTKIVAIDCEMVGTGDDGKDSILARVSIVNHFGQPIYDKYVKPIDDVTDYRTAVSGIRPSDLQKGEDFKVVQKEVNDIIKNRILVGHSLNNDLKVLFLRHPRKNIRDTSNYQLFKKLFNGKRPSLKGLTERLLGVQIQDGEHNSVQDAQAAMRLYTMHRKRWESEIKQRYPHRDKTNWAKKKLEQSAQKQGTKSDEPKVSKQKQLLQENGFDGQRSQNEADKSERLSKEEAPCGQLISSQFAGSHAATMVKNNKQCKKTVYVNKTLPEQATDSQLQISKKELGQQTQTGKKKKAADTTRQKITE